MRENKTQGFAELRDKEQWLIHDKEPALQALLTMHSALGQLLPEAPGASGALPPVIYKARQSITAAGFQLQTAGPDPAQGGSREERTRNELQERPAQIFPRPDIPATHDFRSQAHHKRECSQQA